MQIWIGEHINIKLNPTLNHQPYWYHAEYFIDKLWNFET